MASIAWPSSLPQRMRLRNFSGPMSSGAIATEMDSGPPFQRQRFSAAPEPFRGSVFMTKAQYKTFRTFWESDTAHGAEKFNWAHPITNVTAEVQFDVGNPPRVVPRADDLFEVSMNILVLPTTEIELVES